MSVTQQNNRKRDWSLIILILPLGVAMMLCVGQLAIRMSPNWTVEGEMKSLLDPEKVAKQDALVIQPISGDILTPVSWWNTFLTPSGDSGSGIVFPPFVIFEPTSTPTATVSPSATSTTSSPTATSSITSTPTPPTSTPTKKPTDDVTSTPPTVTATTTTPSVTATTTTPSATATTTTPSATATTTTPSVTATTTTPSATATTTTPSATATTTTPTTCTDSAANNYGGALPCIYPTSSPLVGSSTPVPGNIGVGPPNGTIGSVPDGYYIVINLGSPILVVNSPSDTNADLVYYEQAAAPGVQMDQVIISISMDGSQYYVVFNWSDGVPDNNSNVGDVAGSENDNQPINASELYDPDGAGPAPDTGILIDVDNATSNPPPGAYQYIAIQAPDLPSNTDTDVAFDSVDLVDVPIPP